jgi:thiol-disulfide isomerase/thioredoxin
MRFIFSARFITGFFTGVISLFLLFVVAVPMINKLAQSKSKDSMAAPFLPNVVDAEFDWILQDLGGDDFDFSTLKGKTVFLSVWSPDCPYCVAELPYLQSLYEKTRDDGIEFAVVSVKESDKVLDLMIEYNLTYPIYTYKEDRPELYQTGKTPSTFIIAPDGKLAFRWMGPARWDDDSFINYLRGLSIMGQNPIADEVTN